MYEAFYGLTAKPFQLNPDPSFYFGSKQHRRAKAYLDYGVMRNEGFIVITGEIGAGKTTHPARPAEQPEPQQRRRRSAGHDAARRRRHAAHGRRRVRLSRQGCTEVGAADHPRGVPDHAGDAGQALPADRRRGAEPLAACRRGIAHAVELPVRQRSRCCRAFWSASPSFATSCAAPRWSSSGSGSRPPATRPARPRGDAQTTSSIGSSVRAPRPASPSSSRRPSRRSTTPVMAFPAASIRCATGCCCSASWATRCG